MKGFKCFTVCLVVLGLFVGGCATTLPADVPRKIEPLKFEKTPEYKLDLSKIQTPDKPVLLYGKLLKDNAEDGEMVFVDNPSEATHIIFSSKEFAKVVAGIELATVYKDLLKEHEALVNSYILQINSLKEYVELEKLKSISYRNMWIDSENLFKAERNYRKSQNIVNKVGMVLVGGASIALIAVAL